MTNAMALPTPRAIAFPWQEEVIIRHSQRILKSFQHWTERCLLEVTGSPIEIAQALFEAPAVKQQSTPNVLLFHNRNFTDFLGRFLLLVI
jgi:hypothetical protein